MADEHVDALLLSARFDPSGLEAIPGAVNQALRDAQQGIPEMEFIDAAELRAQLAQSGVDVASFFGGVRTELSATITDSAQLAEALSAVDALELTFGNAGPASAAMEDLAAKSLSAAAAFREAGVAEKDLNAVLERSGFLATQAAQANTGSIRITRDKVADLKLLAGQLQQIPNVADAANASLNRLNAAFDAAGAAGRRGSEGAAAWERGLANIAATNQAASNSFAASNRSANLLRGGLVTLAAQSLGTSSAIGQLAQSALFFAGGATGVIVVAGAVLALSKAYEVLTAKAREAKKAQDDAVESAVARIAADVSPEAKEANDRGALRRELATLANEELGLEKAIAAAGNDNAKIVAFTVGLQKNLAEQKRLTAALSLDEARAEADIAREAQAASNALIGGLGQQLAALQLGERAAQRLAVANQAHTESERAAALAIFDEITALKASAKARDDAARAAEEAARAQAELTARFNAFWDDIEAKANLAGPLVVRRLKEIQAAQEKAFSDKLTAQITAGFEAAADGVANIKTPADLAAEAAERLAVAFDQMDGSVFVLGRIGDALGIIDAQGQQALDSIRGLIQSIATGDIFGSIGAGIDLLGSVFGSDATSLEHERIQEQNTEAIRRNTEALERSATPGGLAGTQDILGAIDPATRSALDALSKMPGIFGGLTLGILEQQLDAAGSSLEELSDIAEANGITLLDSKGRLVAGALDALEQKIQQATEAATTFADTLDEQTRRADIAAQLAGGDQDPAAAFARQLDVIRDFSPAIDQAFQGVDLSDKDAVRDAALELFDQFDSGFFAAHPELLGDISKDDFLAFLEDSADFLDTFGQSVDDATKSLTNIPDTFKLAAAEFSARSVDIAPATAFSGPLVNSQGTTGTVITGGTFNFQVVAQPGMSPGDIARRVKQEFEAEAQADFGLRGAP